MEKERTAPRVPCASGTTDAPLLGKLVLHAGTGHARLGIEVWCPYCGHTHSHGFSVTPGNLDRVAHRVAHCTTGSPFEKGGYFIALDPADAEHNRAMIAKLPAGTPVRSNAIA